MSFFTNLDVYQGANFSKTFVHKDINRIAIDITGYTIRATLRKEYESSAQSRFTSSIVTAAQGKLKIELTSSQTTALESGRYVYDVLLYTADSPRTYVRAFEGQVTVHPAATKLADFDSPNSP